jgi:hypothetical protein
VVDARTSSTSVEYRIDIRSPDAIQVDAAGGTLILLSYPSRR